MLHSKITRGNLMREPEANPRAGYARGNLVREPTANLWDGDARVKIASEPLTINVRARKKPVGWVSYYETFLGRKLLFTGGVDTFLLQ
jgi:hypothetical protein